MTITAYIADGPKACEQMLLVEQRGDLHLCYSWMSGQTRYYYPFCLGHAHNADHLKELDTIARALWERAAADGLTTKPYPGAI
jgi:hypothetical protein